MCPCAHCQGHGGQIEFVPGGNSELRQIEPVGHYALKLVWGDGHESGIYTFAYLRELGDRADVTTTESATTQLATPTQPVTGQKGTR